MRELRPQDLEIFYHLYVEGLAIAKASKEGVNPEDRNTWPAAMRTYENIRQALVTAFRNHATFEDLQIALEEITRSFEIARIQHDPAYDPTLVPPPANDN